MTVSDLLKESFLNVINKANEELPLTSVYCCDLLSVAMSKAPANSAWVTVMSNINTLAVATLTDVSCIILAGGITADDKTIATAKAKNICLLSSNLPVFETALKIHEAIKNE